MSQEIQQSKQVQIDRSNFLDRSRFVCPAGHMSWERTNNHGWCESCASAAAQGADVEPEFYEIWDKREDRYVDYDDILFEGPDETSHRRLGAD